VDHVFGDEGMVVLSGMVVDDCRIGSSARNSIEAQPFVVLLLVSTGIHVEGGFVLVDLIQLGAPPPKFSHGHAVDNMAASETLNFLFTSDCTVEVDSFPLNGLLVLDGTVDVEVES
jgi:hypothetical protein